MRETLTRLRYRYWPDHLLGEILSKRWTETAIPVILLLIVGFALSRSLEHFLSPSSLADTARQAGEIVSQASLNYINRLSDFLFVAGRCLNDKGARDVLWVPGANR